jgi:Uma2 family endonuclease
MLRLAPGLVRNPDVSFIARDRLVDGKLPAEPIATIAPDLAVEILSEGNTSQEMDRKLREYFNYGTRLVWYVDPRRREIDVYRSATTKVTLSMQDALSGDPVLPGFSVLVKEIFFCGA